MAITLSNAAITVEAVSLLNRGLSQQELTVVYKVALQHSEEGYSITVPGLPGCCSQGATEEEALENIVEAIREYLAVAAELASELQAREVEVLI